MKPILTLLFGLVCSLALGQVLELDPKIGPKLDFSPQALAAFEDCLALSQKIAGENRNWDQLSDQEKGILAPCAMKESIWSTIGMGDGWYTGMITGPQITASSTLPSQGKYSYEAEHIHDFSYQTAWVEGATGYGIGEHIQFTFPPETPRIHTVKIVNGYVAYDWAWKSNSRVKKLKMYLNGELFAYLNLQDISSEQHFSFPAIGYEEREDLDQLKQKAPWSIKFEIAEVYPGTKYEDVALAEIFFDGLDVLCLAARTPILMADQSLKNIEDLKVGEKVMSFNTQSGQWEAAQILALAGPVPHKLIKIHFSDGRSLTCTPDHPFFDGEHWYAFEPEKTMRDYQFEEVYALEVGTQLLTVEDTVQITRIENYPKTQSTFTIVELDKNQTFVAQGLIVGAELLRGYTKPLNKISE